MEAVEQKDRQKERGWWSHYISEIYRSSHGGRGTERPAEGERLVTTLYTWDLTEAVMEAVEQKDRQKERGWLPHSISETLQK